MNKFLKYVLCFIATVAVLAFGLIVYLLWFQPPFYFPKPTGKYAVGSKEYHWIDTKRKEIYSDDPLHPNRELMVKIWYPTNGKLSEKPTTPYAPYLVEYYKKNHTLLWLIGFSRHAYVYAKPDLALAATKQQFPVIIFSPGFRNTRDGNTAQCEELASHGYIVVGISHPYDNCVVQFPDGRIIDGLRSIAKRSREAGEISLSKLAEKNVDIWFSDLQFILNQLEQLAKDNNSLFYNHFDQNHIGIFGHSMGGSIAFQIARRDTRIKTAVNLDETCLVGQDQTKPLNKPGMIILGGNWVSMMERPLTQNEWKKFGIHTLDEEEKEKSKCLPVLKQLALSTPKNLYIFVVKNTGHFDFCDFTLYKWASYIFRIAATFDYAGLHLGSIDGLHATTIISDYLVNFFDKYLKNKPSELLDGNQRVYPEVGAKQWK